MTPAPLQFGAGALGVGAEQRRLHAVGLRERLADRVEQPGVGRRVAPPRAADRGLVDRHHAVPPGHRAVDQRALARARHAGDHHQHAERDVDVDVLQVVGARRRAPPAPPTASAPTSFSEARSSRCRPVSVSLARSPSTVPSNTTSPPAGAGAGAEVDDVVGDRDRLRLVLDDEHGVALVAQLQQQVVHPLDVVRVQADRRLVEDVGDVGERRAEVADHLGALRLAARQRARRPVEREVAEPDLHERVERCAAAPPSSGATDGSSRPRDPLGQVADLHRAGVGDVDPLDLRRPGRLAEPGAVALGAGGERHRPLHEGADVRLHRVDVLGQERLLDLRDQARVGQVDARRP